MTNLDPHGDAVFSASPELFYAALRNDFLTFIQKAFEVLNPGQTYYPNWHIDTMAYHLQQAAAGKIKRLIINLPPRHLKSLVASVALPAWILGRDPAKRIICVSYAQELARKLGLDCHQVVENEFYQKVFPGMHLSEKPNTDQEFATTKNGFRLATSIGGTLTGRGGNMIIIDDPLKPQDALSDSERMKVNEWYSNTLLSRLDNKSEGVIIIVMQRLHPEDLVGHVARLDDWTFVNIPAVAELEEEHILDSGVKYVRKAGEVIDPAREPIVVIDRLRRGLSEQVFAAQYQQNPIPAGGRLIKWEWFKRYEKTPERFDFIAQSWDTASGTEKTNDYSVCTTWGVLGFDFYLLDVFRERLAYPDLRDRAIQLKKYWKADAVLIEKTGIGLGLSAEMDRANVSGVFAQTPKQGKLVRVTEQTSVLADGHVFLPLAARWLKDFKDEATEFPQGRHDDQVDSMEAFLRCALLVRRGLATSSRRDLMVKDAQGRIPGFGGPSVTFYTIGPKRLVTYTE